MAHCERPGDLRTGGVRGNFFQRRVNHQIQILKSDGADQDLISEHERSSKAVTITE